MSLPIHIPEVLEHLLRQAEAIKASEEALSTYID